MNITKLTWGAVGLVALGAAGLGVKEFVAASEAVGAQAEALRNGAEVRTKIVNLEKKLEAETKRAEAVESDNAALASAVLKAQAARAKPKVAVSNDELVERVQRAVTLAREGDAVQAMRELLDCYDSCVAQPDRRNFAQLMKIARGLAELGERHPAALVELRERMARARKRVEDSAGDTEPLREMAAITRALKDDGAMISLYDEIPAGDMRRKLVAIYAGDAFVTAQRYGDALIGRNGYAGMSSAFEVEIRPLPPLPFSAEVVEKVKATARNHAITSAAKNIEVLAGAGDLVHARELAGRLLAYDGSEATRALVQKHLERAGQPGLLAQEGGK